DAWRSGTPLIQPSAVSAPSTGGACLPNRKPSAGDLRERTRPSYRRSMSIVADLPLTKPQAGRARTGEPPVKSLTPAAVSRLCGSLVAGCGKLQAERHRQAELNQACAR